MRWLCFTLADHSEVQEKVFEEICASIEKDSEIIIENRPFTRSVLLENMSLTRCRIELPKILYFKEFQIKNGAVVQGSIEILA
jgi:hypothetical protein